jgi:UDP-N-acetylmuramate dehydrogenase
MSESLAARLRAGLPQLEVRENEPLSLHTSFRIGGPARVLVLPGSAGELARTVRLLRSLGERPLVLGNGTNVLAPDQGLERCVIVTAKAERAEIRGDVLEADCGVSLTALAAKAAKAGLQGLVFAYGIPGTLGGALVMNAGAYGGEMKDVSEETRFLDENLEERVFRGAEQGFGYRRSAFTGDMVLLSARLRLRPGDPEALWGECRALLEKRRHSQPLDLPSAGSAFKRPEGAYAAALIDRAGLKGFRIGGAMVSEKHAGFVVNAGGASADDVKRLLEAVRERVFKDTGITLEPEIRML